MLTAAFSFRAGIGPLLRELLLSAADLGLWAAARSLQRLLAPKKQVALASGDRGATSEEAPAGDSSIQLAAGGAARTEPASSGADAEMGDAAADAAEPGDSVCEGDWVEAVLGLRSLASRLPSKAKSIVAQDAAARPDPFSHARGDVAALFSALAAGASGAQLRHYAAAAAAAATQAAPAEIGWVSPKFAALAQRLRESPPPPPGAQSGAAPPQHPWRCVVFVQRRATAVALAELLEATLAPEVPLRIGVQTGYAFGCAASRTRQREVLRQFRKGELNLLVATDVLEEGALPTLAPALLRAGGNDVFLCAEVPTATQGSTWRSVTSLCSST